MTIQEVLVQLTSQHGMNLEQTPVPRALTLTQGSQQLRIRCSLAGIDVELYQRGAGEYAGTLVPLFAVTLLVDADAWQPSEISWTLEFWQDEGVAVDHAWFVQHCADHLVAGDWLTQARLLREEAVP